MKVITPEEVRSKMLVLSEKKKNALEDIGNKLAIEYRAEATAKAAADKAAETLDFDANHAAQMELAKIHERKELLKRQEAKLTSLEMISEKESDDIIDGLQEYIVQLGVSFEAEASKHIDALQKAVDEYHKNHNAAEQTIQEWTSTIHRNYRSFKSRFNPDGTYGPYRSDTPVPVPKSPTIDSVFLTKKYVSDIQLIQSKNSPKS